MGTLVLSMSKLENSRLGCYIAEAAMTVVCRVAVIADNHAVVHGTKPLICERRGTSRLFGDYMMSVLYQIVQIFTTSRTAAILPQPGGCFRPSVEKKSVS